MVSATRHFRPIVTTSAGVVLVAACMGELSSSVAQGRRASDGIVSNLFILRGATIEGSGYATILTAPPTEAMTPTRVASPPPPPAPPPADGRPTALPMTREARAARSRMANPDGATRKAAQALNLKLSVAERGNYVGLRVVRDPTARIAFQFRRNAAATLARYTQDPRFTSCEGGIPRAELQPIFDEWWSRFRSFRLVGGGAVDEFDGVVRFDMNIDEAGFREIAAHQRWTLPARLELHFSSPRQLRSIDPALSRFVRVFAREDRSPAIINEALLSGRVILRDGCFRLTDHGAPDEPIVIFGRDVELGLDAQNYMVIKQTGLERAAPRIGEMLRWGGPRYFSEADPGVKCFVRSVVQVRSLPSASPKARAGQAKLVRGGRWVSGGQTGNGCVPEKWTFGAASTRRSWRGWRLLRRAQMWIPREEALVRFGRADD